MYEFSCSFKEVGEFTGLNFKEGDKLKLGRYTDCSLPMAGYGSKIWAFVAYVDVDLEHFRSLGLEDDVIVQKCIDFLNTKPKRRRKPLYGNLSLNTYNVLEDKGLISVCLYTNEYNNKNFWGKGCKIAGKR